MIDKLQLRFGRGPGAQAEEIITSPVTVFVGPNNSGKTKILNELRDYCVNGQMTAGTVMLTDIYFDCPKAEEVDDLVSSVARAPLPGERIIEGYIDVGKRGVQLRVPEAQLRAAVVNPNSSKEFFCSWYLRFHTLMLDGQSRLSLVNSGPAGDLLAPPETTLQVLLADDKTRSNVREILADAFGMFFVVDPTKLGHLRI